MRKKSKIFKKISYAFLAASMMFGIVGMSAIKSHAERSYEPYAVSEGKKGQIQRDGWETRSYGTVFKCSRCGETHTSGYRYYPEEYSKEGVGYYLRHKYNVEPVYAGKSDGNAQVDPQVVIGDLKANIVETESGKMALYIEGKWEINLENNWTTSADEAAGNFKSYDPSAVTYFKESDMKTLSNYYINPDEAEWKKAIESSLKSYKTYIHKSDTDLSKGSNRYSDPKKSAWDIAMNNIKEQIKSKNSVAATLGDTWGPGDNKITWYYMPRVYYIQLLINGTIYKVPLDIANDTMLLEADSIVKYDYQLYWEKMMCGEFSQYILIPDLEAMKTGSSSKTYLQKKDLKSLYVDWVLSVDTPCKIEIPLDGSEADLSKPLIEDVGIIKAETNATNSNKIDYTIDFITNCMNKNQMKSYSYTLKYDTPSVKDQSTTFNLNFNELGERKHREVNISLPKTATNIRIIDERRLSQDTTYLKYRRNTVYKVNDFRIETDNTAALDSVVTVKKDGKIESVTVNLERYYKINYDSMRGAFEFYYQNDKVFATKDMKDACFYANFTYYIKKEGSAEHKERKLKKAVYLKDKSGTFNVSAEFPGDVVKIEYDGLTGPEPYSYSEGRYKILYKDTESLPAPTKFSAEISADTKIQSDLKYRELRLRVDYASPNTHKYKLNMVYREAGETGITNQVQIFGKTPSFTAKAGYHSVGYGVSDTDTDTGNQPIQSIPKDVKYIKLVSIDDITDGSSYEYNQFLYCAHDYDNRCDDRCNWCHKLRVVPDCDLVRIDDKKATCTEPGCFHYQCSICKKEYDKYRYEAELGHDMKEVIDVEPTDTTAGSKRRVCKNCGYEEKYIMPALGNENGEVISDDENINDPDSGKPNSGNSSNNGTGDGAGNGGSTDGLGKDGTALGEGASQAAADKVITESKSEEDPAGAVFAKLQLKAKKVTKNSVTLSWKKISGSEYVVYGAKCGDKFEKLTTTKKNTYTVKKLKKAKYYRYMVVAVKSGKVVSSSKAIHVATKGGKIGNYKKVKLNKTKVTLKLNKTAKISAKQVVESKNLKVKKHRALKYESSDTAVATVSSNGKIKAVGKGTAYIYVYSQNGVSAKVKVTVK